MVATWALLLVLSPVQAYQQGNALSAAKDYTGAARAYEEALRGGPSAAVLHNLGNALFKKGQVGRAILSYRRARYLSPRDQDIAGNLEFARRYRIDKLPAAPSPIAMTLDAAFHRLSRTEAALLAALCFTLAASCLAAWIIWRWNALLLVASLMTLVFVFGFVTQQTWKAEIDGRPAVVVVPETHALSAPSDDAQQILLLHDGTEVRIREARGSYLLVQLPGGNGGWVRNDAVERVYGPTSLKPSAGVRSRS